MNRPVKCELCSSRKPLVRDHCHRTNMLRGHLCRGCNLALNNRWEDPDWRAKALAYLSRDLGVLYSITAKRSRKHGKRVRSAPRVSGSDLRYERQRRGMSVLEVSKRLGMARQTITDWESGRKVPQMETIRKVVVFLSKVPLLPDLGLKQEPKE